MLITNRDAPSNRPGFVTTQLGRLVVISPVSKQNNLTTFGPWFILRQSPKERQIEVLERIVDVPIWERLRVTVSILLSASKKWLSATKKRLK